MDPTGRRYSVLYTFSGEADGATPYAPLVRDAAGNLYGTAGYGGNTSSSCFWGASGCGVVFKLDPSGKETVLHTFTGGADGYLPFAGLVRDQVGNLYGTTSAFIGPGDGVGFKLFKSREFEALHTFSGTDGATPFYGSLLPHEGSVYGTTSQGGAYGYGVVFKLN